MTAGEQDEPVFFEAPTTVNTDGEAITTFTDQSGNSPATPDFAKVVSQRGNEAFESARTNATRFIRVRVRYRTDVKKCQLQIYNTLPHPFSLARHDTLRGHKVLVFFGYI